MSEDHKNKYYTGIGARETPLDILYLMVKCANIFEKKGFILRSGSAKGADYAFESGVMNIENEEIFVPDEKFAYFKYKLKKPNYFIPSKDNPEAFKEANKLLSVHNLHPTWNLNMNPYPRLLHNRNIFQVLGKKLELNPFKEEKSKFILCYTKDKATCAKETSLRTTGGSGTAIRAGDFWGIEIYNLSREDHLERILRFIQDNNHLIDYDYIGNVILKSDFNKDFKSLRDLFPQDFNLTPNQEKSPQKRKRKP